MMYLGMYSRVLGDGVRLTAQLNYINETRQWPKYSNEFTMTCLLLLRQTVSKYVKTHFLKLVHFCMHTLTKLMEKNGHRLRYIQMVIILNFNSSSINMPHRWMTNQVVSCLQYHLSKHYTYSIINFVYFKMT